jgi:phospho-N-acetylmuramoyl-pentapeptide-transferase
MALLLGTIIFSFLLHSLLIVPFINFLYNYRFYKSASAVDKSKTDEASDHIRSKSRTPEGGGLLILIVTSVVFAIALPLMRYLGFHITHVYPIQSEINILFFTFISFGLLGLYDDVIKYFEIDRQEGYAGLRTSHKLVLQVILGLLVGAMMYFNLGLDIIHVPFIGVINFGPLFIPLAAFLIITFANAVNITDGMDGLAPGLLMICLFGLLIISSSILDIPLSLFIALWLGGLIAFLYFNVFPARLFLGDVGALAFGATLATVGLLTGKMVALVIIGLPFLIDGLSSLVQILSVKIFKRRILPIAPIHYYLLKIGWTEPKIVQRAWLVGIMFVVFGVFLAVL